METVTKNKLYEGMFLLDSALAGSDWDGVNNTIKTILEKAGAEIVTTKKWDDRKLAYEIKGKNRGTYILCYFRVDGGKIKDIENAVKLSEKIMRVLILSAEKMTDDDIEKDTPATRAEKETQKVPDETERDQEVVAQDGMDEETEQKDEPDVKNESDVEEGSDVEAEQDELTRQVEEEMPTAPEVIGEVKEPDETLDDEQDSKIRE